MRYITIRQIKTGMILGQDIYDGTGKLLLAKHQVLKKEHIANLENFGYPGLYIDDEFTQGIEAEEMIKPQLKQRALELVHDLFISDEHKEDAAEQEWRIREIVMKVVEDILSRGDVMYNMINLKNYDDYTYFHSVNVAILSAVIGARYGMEEYDLRILTTAALLHDIGKKFLEIDILNAKRALTEEERRIVLQHPKLGYEFLRDYYDFAPEVYMSVLEHHESYSGEGYPMRKSGEEITIYARIIKMADVYDAMTSKRPYRSQMSPSDAVEYIMAMNGSEFDPQLVEVFLTWVAAYPAGCTVELSDGRTAVVKYNYPGFALRPKVRIEGTGEEVDLKTDCDARSITITRLMV